jgi:Restriction endonuclease AspBHI N-terminal/Restriction endonuclease
MPSPSRPEQDGQTYRIGHAYKDTGGSSRPDDQFLRWINVKGSGMLNSPGIRPLGFVNLALDPLPAYIILVTHERTAGRLNPWDDIVDLPNGRIWYWGDAKFDDKKKFLDFSGNKCLWAVHDTVLENRLTLVPPILHFSKPERGLVVFNGLCIMRKVDVTWFEDHGKPVKNLHVHLDILDQEDVPVAWLHDRALASSEGTLDRNAPTAWTNYVAGRPKFLDLWSPRIRSKSSQLPPEGTAEASLLRELCNFSPTEFEAAVVDIIRRTEGVRHHITRTRPVGDNGFDFYGHFALPHPLSYEIPLKGEAKRYGRKTPVTPEDVSRLVARLTRGEYGLFMTTSYFTDKAQREVLEDRYPVHLIAGVDLVNLLKALKVISGGVLSSSWVSGVREQAATKLEK